MLDETLLRRPDFQPGVPIRLRDGQNWHFSRPQVQWRKTRRDDIPGQPPRTSVGAAFDDAMSAIDRAETTPERLAGLFALAEAMLLQQYDLTADDLAGLLVYDPADTPDPDLYESENRSAWAAIVDVATGRAPRTIERWAVLTSWLAAGPPSEWIDLADFHDFVELIVATGHGVPARKWVTELIEADQAESLEAIGPC